MRATIENIALAALVIAVLATSGVSTVAWVSTSRLVDNNEQVVRAQRLVASVESLRFNALALDAGEQNYTITGHPRDLAPFKLALVEIKGELSFLRSQSAANPQITEFLPLLERLAFEYVTSERAIVDARGESGFPAAQAMVRSGESDRRQERLLGATERLLVSLRKRQGVLEAEQVALGDRVRWLTALFIGGSSAVLVALYLTLRRLTRQQRETQAALRHQAIHDPLTGLPNRAGAWEHLDRCLADQDAIAALGGIAILLIDLDGFKSVNDQHGHDAGDELLRQVARRISGATRDTDFVARLGGDEFLVVLPQESSPETVGIVARKLVSVLGSEYEVLGHSIRQVTASIGISRCPGDAKEREALLKCADLALYRAKSSGRNTFQLFEPDSKP